jgi:integrase/recombinase XerD
VSVLRKAAHEYLSIRRALGYKLEAQGHLLLQFIDYLEQRGALVITTELALEWARQPADASQLWWHQRLSVVRGFARHLVGLDPRTEVPANDLLPARFRRAVPYLYSEAEIARLMRAARAIPTPLKAATFETLIGLLSVTGMRVSEAIWLDRDDVDLDGEWLLIRRAKNERSREVPLHQSTVQALCAYALLRDELCTRPLSQSFLVTSTGGRLHRRTIWHVFDDLRRRAGIVPRSSACRPRVHDMRHAYVLRTLLRWYRAGSDVEAQLPLLSTYLGHVDPASTYWYFEGAPELLALAAQRLERAWEELR